jgi:phosphoglycerol transferase MdoB-like AlkP superfamily enzyme
MTKKLPANLVLFVKIYLIVLPIFSLFRVILLITELNRIQDAPALDIMQAFIMGLRFDIVISGYILSVSFILLSIVYIIKGNTSISRLFLSGIKYFIMAMFALAFAVCAADIPYFNHFFSRFTITAFEWIDNPEFVFKMIVQEPYYWASIVPFTLMLIAFGKLIQKSFSVFSSTHTYIKRQVVFLSSLLFLSLMLLGVRGRVDEKSPIRIGTAYFSNNPFLNQLGLNPNFTLMRSFLDANKKENKEIQLMDPETAVKNVQSYLNIQETSNEQPLMRKVEFDNHTAKNYNVVLILMESMSAAKMKRHGNQNDLTPFLDSISAHGYYFENAYTSGIHTMNGVFSTLFSYPAIFRQHPMKESIMRKYPGMYYTFKKNGYSTIYFTTHDGQFDNIEGFLKANDCEKVVSKSDYPKEKAKTTLGVPDDYMFEFSIPILNQLHDNNKGFFATFLTSSDHGPYYIPEYFEAKSNGVRNKIVEYADFSLRKFIEMSSKQEWFDNTLFVFIADHGSPSDNLYDMSLNYHHSPLLFYAPAILKDPKTFSKMASQIDVFPTIMGLLQRPYYNQTFGIDLFRESREFAIINAYDKYGVIGQNWFLMVRADKSRSLYKYKENDLYDYSKEFKDNADKMDIFAKSNLQAFQHLKKSNKLYAD